MRPATLSLIISLCLPGLALAQDQQQKPTATKKASTPDPETEKLIEAGLQAYRKGHHQAAVEALQKAINKIQKEGTRGLADFLPEVEGWKADKPDSSSGSWGGGDQQFQWSQVDCSYRSGDAKVDVTITNSPLLVQSQQMMVGNPQIIQMMNMDPNKTVTAIKTKGWSGFKMVEKGEKSSVVAIAGKLLVTIEAPGGDLALVERFLGAMDLEGLAAASR